MIGNEPGPNYGETIFIAKEKLDGDPAEFSEYCRGVVDLIADMYGVAGVHQDERMEQVARDLGLPSGLYA